jgi:tetratricopeptide (TPR) repeat protein
MREYAEALTTLEKASGLEPDNAEPPLWSGYVLKNRGRLLVERGETKQARASYADALSAFDRALELDPDDDEIQAYRDETLRDRDDLLSSR